MKTLPWNAILASNAAAIVISLGLGACTPATAPEMDTPQAPVVEAPIAPAPAPAPAVTPAPPTAPAVTAPAPAPAPQAAVKRTGPLLLNASFENREENGAPKQWNVGNPDTIAASTDATDGVHVLALTGAEEGYGIVAQPVNILPTDLGSTLVITADTLSPVPGQLTLDVMYTVDGEKESVSVVAPEGEEWQEVSVNAPLPKNADPKSVRFRINIRPGAQGKYLVDNVRAAFE